MSWSPDAPRRTGPGLAISIVVMAIAGAIGITGLAVGVTKAVHRISHFEDGPRGDVTVIGPDGSELPVREMPGNLTETVEDYDAFARFDVARPALTSSLCGPARAQRSLKCSSASRSAVRCTGWSSGS